jgi:hypothetical protein
MGAAWGRLRRFRLCESSFARLLSSRAGWLFAQSLLQTSFVFLDDSLRKLRIDVHTRALQRLNRFAEIQQPCFCRETTTAIV